MKPSNYKQLILIYEPTLLEKKVEKGELLFASLLFLFTPSTFIKLSLIFFICSQYKINLYY